MWIGFYAVRGARLTARWIIGWMCFMTASMTHLKLVDLTMGRKTGSPKGNCPGMAVSRVSTESEELMEEWKGGCMLWSSAHYSNA